MLLNNLETPLDPYVKGKPKNIQYLKNKRTNN